MSIIQLHNIHLAYGSTPLLNGASLSIERGDRIAIIGRNGEGKSSLLKVVGGRITPDDGRLIFDKNLKIATLEQEIPTDLTGTVYELVSEGLGVIGEKLKAYYALLEDATTDAALNQLGILQQELDQLNGWNSDQAIDEILTRLELDGKTRLNTLSGGWIRRALLAKALVSKPDLLLLDEPTNHLDIEMIRWLEERLLEVHQGAILFVSHDRAFLGRIATKIVELDRGNLSEYPGNYDEYLKRKAIELYNEEQENRAFDKKLASEEVWIKKGVKARRTRSEARVQALLKMREERAERVNRQGTATLHFEEAGVTGAKVIEATDMSYAIGGKTIADQLNLTVMRGDRIGIIGPNGVGKSTLIKLLLGQLSPDKGEVKLGTQLEVAYFDQLRSDLELDKTVLENVGEGSDFIEINGKKRHVMGWLQDFMFSPDRARSPVNALPGGERTRLLLAKLFTKPCNFLVMDEPTNDLDIETLELLEDLLLQFNGTLLLISHDRAFIDQVVTSLLILEGEGKITESIGGYSDWEAYRDARDKKAESSTENRVKSETQTEAEHKTSVNEAKPTQSQGKKLSYHEVRELESLPELIANLESEIEVLTNEVQTVEFYETSHAYQQERLHHLTELNETLEQKYERWLDLESRVG